MLYSWEKTSERTAVYSGSRKDCRTKFGEGRVFDTPLAESAIIGTSIGMAVCGMRPIREIQFAGFMLMRLQPGGEPCAR